LPPPTELNDYLDGGLFFPIEKNSTKRIPFCVHLCLYVLSQMQNGRGLQEIVNVFL